MPSQRTDPAAIAEPMGCAEGSYVPAAPTSTTPPAAAPRCSEIAWAAPAPAAASPNPHTASGAGGPSGKSRPDSSSVGTRTSTPLA